MYPVRVYPHFNNNPSWAPKPKRNTPKCGKGPSEDDDDDDYDNYDSDDDEIQENLSVGSDTTIPSPQWVVQRQILSVHLAGNLV